MVPVGGVAFICVGDIRRTCVGPWRNPGVIVSISLALIAGYGFHATKTAFPLLQLSLFRVRTFSAAVSGSFFTRLGIGGVPFLLLWLVTGPCLGHSISEYAWVASTHPLAALDGHSRGKG
jgi:hypothetical protein